jgi:DnaJ-class molecular chaperone
MAAETPESAEPAEPRPCPPCRGTGRLRSKAGGTEHEVPCPWCEGGGVEIPGHDAQAARRGDADGSGPVAAEVE